MAPSDQPAPPPPTTEEFLLGLIEPAVLLMWAAKHYAIVVFKTIFLRGRILAPILNSRQVRDEAFGRFWVEFSVPRVEQPIKRNPDGTIDTSALVMSSALVPPILEKIRGVVLDIGPGTGSQMPYIADAAAAPENGVSAIYGAEPCVGLHEALQKRIHANGLDGKYHVLPCSAEKKDLVEALKQDGVQVDDKGTFDTIICVRVLCSVPKPEETMADLYTLLRPGGQMLIMEHVTNPWSLSSREGSFLARCAQTIYMALGWSYFVGDCSLTRDTEAGLHKAAEKDGGWESFELKRHHGWSTIPHLSGVLVKRK